MKRPYAIKSTGYSSARLGLCEICGEHVAEVYMETDVYDRDGLFGHEECLRARQAATAVSS